MTSGLHDDVADVTGVARVAIDEFSIDHDAAADTRRHGHRAEVADPDGSPEPPLSESERLRVEIAEDAKTGQLLEVTLQREPVPGGDVDRGDRRAVRLDRTRASDPDRQHLSTMVFAGADQLR